MKKKVLGWCGVGILVIAILVFTVGWFSKSSFERAIIMESVSLAGSWSYDGIAVNEEEKTVSVRYLWVMGSWSNNIEGIHDTYDKLRKIASDNDIFDKYTLDIAWINQGEYFGICNISEDAKHITIEANAALDLKKIAEYFPSANKLHLHPIWYDDISEIKSFNNLSYIRISNNMPESDLAYIKECFPDCEIDIHTPYYGPLE